MADLSHSPSFRGTSLEACVQRAYGLVGAVVIDALTAADPADSIEAPTAMRTSGVVLIASRSLWPPAFG